MNSLSWLLFWADVLPSLSRWLSIVSFLLFCGGIAAGVIGICMLCDSDNIKRVWDPTADNGTGDYVVVSRHDVAQYRVGRLIRNIGFVMAPLFFLLWGASFLVPEKETFYMIAASEAGEQAMQTPEFTKVRKVINQFLDGKIAEDEPKEASNAS